MNVDAVRLAPVPIACEAILVPTIRAVGMSAIYPVLDGELLAKGHDTCCRARMSRSPLDLCRRPRSCCGTHCARGTR